MKQERLWKIACDPDCGFMVRSHEKDELVKLGKMHVKDIHHESVSDSEAKAMIKAA